MSTRSAWAARWSKLRLAHLLEPRTETGQPALDVLSVYRDYGVIRKSSRDDNFNRTPADLTRYQVVHPGDVVVNRMKAWQGSLGVSDLKGLVSPDYEVLRPTTSQWDMRFLHHLLRSRPMIGEYAVRSTGIRPSQWRLYWAQMRMIDVPVPEVPEQRAIADFLDRETSRIDTLIAEQQRLIELLQERRTSLVSGVFAGTSPDNKIQHACIDVVDCPHTTPAVSDDGAYEAVRTASVRGGVYRPGNGLRVDRQTWRERNSGVQPRLGDVLFTREAPAGEACMVPSEDICLGQRMVLLRVDDGVCRGRFLLWQLYSERVQDHFRLAANGSTVRNVRLPVLRSTPIWLPPLDEQCRIVAYLDEQTAKIDTLIAEMERFTGLAQERRAALITAAVTGQIDVRGGAA